MGPVHIYSECTTSVLKRSAQEEGNQNGQWNQRCKKKKDCCWILGEFNPLQKNTQTFGAVPFVQIKRAVLFLPV